jgi:F0F1-type ATP synthase assembly protein I
MSTSDSSEPATPPAEATTRPQDKSPARGMVAGTLLLSGVLLGALVGGVIGALVGAFGPLLAAGLFVGFVGGTAAVIVRFRDL